MGITISSYSLITTILIYNLALVLIYSLRNKDLFLIRYGASVLLFITLLSVIRLFSPVDFLRAYVVQSKILVPAVKSVIEFRPFSPAIGLTIGHFVLLVWLTGTCRFAFKHIPAVHKAMRLRRSYVLTRNEQIERVVKKLDVKAPVRVSAQVKTPHVAGFFRPVIYLPDIDLSDDIWEYILRHEAQHIRSRDMLIKLLYAAIESVMWWNPVSHLFMQELDVMLELRCDAALTAGMSDKGRTEYFEAIMSVLRSLKDSESTQMSVYFAKREKYMHERYYAVFDVEKHAGKRARFAVIAVAFVVFCLSYFVVIQPDYPPPLNKEEGLIIKNEDETRKQFILFDGEKYALFVDNVFSKNLSVTDLAQEPYNTLPIYNSGGD